MISLDPMKKIADAVLYEGFLLYPYTASARKNRARWQFGVVMPHAYASSETGEPSTMQTEVIALPEGIPSLAVCVRFLQLQARTVEERSGDAFVPVAALRVDGDEYITWDEAVEREISSRFPLRPAQCEVVEIDIPAGCEVEQLHDASGTVRGRVLRERWHLRGTITVTCEPVSPLLRIRVHIENSSELAGAERSAALRTALISTHTLLGIESGRFVSLLDAPPFAAQAARECVNERTWPVLAGQSMGDGRFSSLVLSSPIILYDFPAVAEQTTGNAFDGTEIDELLNLSVLSLSDAERREARATDPAARAIVDRAESTTTARLASLHAMMRADCAPERADEAMLIVQGRRIGKGSRVRLRPARRADVWDSFIAGKTARVRGIYRDMDDRMYVAVIVEDDPASEFHEWYGRSLFFDPDEIEPLEASAP
ncbi:MAG: hypothetical protein ACXVA3_07290 [Vulcanimicrobiaceae bacterium]